MNKELNLVEILKDCPVGTEFYHVVYGRVWLAGVCLDDDCPIRLSINNGLFTNITLTEKGTFSKDYDGECLLFPSKDQRDWSKFKFKKPKFDPKTLKPFNKGLTKHIGRIWRCDLFSHYREKNGRIESYCTNEGYIYSYCIPYNNETKHLIGTTKEAPEYYRYWED